MRELYTNSAAVAAAATVLQRDYINRPRPSLRNALASAIDG